MHFLGSEGSLKPLIPDSAKSVSSEAGITSGLHGLNIADGRKNKPAPEMAKQPVKDDPASFLRSSASSTLGIQTEPISTTSSEGAVMHRNALSIHKHPLPLDPTKVPENKDVRTTTSLYFTSQSSKMPAQQRTNMSVTLPARSDIEIVSSTVQPRLSLPTNANTIAISVRRNSEGGHQTIGGGGEGGTPTSATLPITTPITNSLLANINSVPPTTSSSVNQASDHAGAASFPVFSGTDQISSSLETENSVFASSSNSMEGPNSSSNNNSNNFSDANLPRITARDFSPGRVLHPGGRRIVKAKKIAKK